MIRRFFGWDSPKTVAKVHALFENLETLALAVAIIFEVFFSDFKRSDDAAWVILVIADVSQRLYGWRDKQISEAEKSALEANLGTLREAVADRRLTDEQSQRIAASLSAFAGRLINVCDCGPSGEAMAFSRQILASLVNAGWKPQLAGTQIGPMTELRGVHVLVARSQEIFLAASALVSVLRSEGIEATYSYDPGWLCPTPTPPGVILLFVAPKPPGHNQSARHAAPSISHRQRDVTDIALPQAPRSLIPRRLQSQPPAFQAKPPSPYPIPLPVGSTWRLAPTERVRPDPGSPFRFRRRCGMCRWVGSG